MKLKHILVAFAASLAIFTSCDDDQNLLQLGSVEVTKSIAAIPADGGADTIYVKANGNWTLRTKDAKGIEKDSLPAWLTVTPTNGEASNEPVPVIFKAEKTTKSLSTTLYLTCNGETQRIDVMQQAGKVELPISTCAEFLAGPNGDSYRIKGTVTKIANATYGNMYINDGTGEAYIYGTLDANGGEKNFASLGIEVGDEVTVQGPKDTYNGTIELKNVTVIAINKSLIKVDSLSTEKLGKEGGELIAYLTVKGDGVSVDAPDWMSLKSLSTSGTIAKVVFKVAANAGGDRTAELKFTTQKNGKEYTSTKEFTQKGSIVPLTISEFNAMPTGDAQYRLTGVINNVTNTDNGRFNITDYSGSTYVYNLGEKGTFTAKGLKEGDIITLVGKRAEYKGSVQVGNSVYEASYNIDEAPVIGIADFRNAAESKTQYYRISGTIVKSSEAGTKFDLNKYGNFSLKDDNGDEIYVYGLLTGWNGEKQQCAKLGLKEGDKITIIGYRTSYNGLIQVGGAFFYTKD